MISRGHFVGEIIDSLSTISFQVGNRCAVGLTDLNKYLENFFCEILNHILGINLCNLNNERSNEPGLDLGDERSEIAFQITSQKTSSKINDTLKKITADQFKKYKMIHILIIGEKQQSYSGLDVDLCTKLDFNESRIWDINALCKKSIDLRLDSLKSLYEYISNELIRVKIELEIPDKEGNFPTNIQRYIEEIPKPSIGKCTYFYDYCKEHFEWTDIQISHESVEQDITTLAGLLSGLPRITREFLAFLIERRDEETYSYGFRFNVDKLNRICSFPDKDGDIKLLKEYRFISVREPEESLESYCLEISFPVGQDNVLIFEVAEYIEENKIGYRKPIICLDFSDF